MPFGVSSKRCIRGANMNLVGDLLLVWSFVKVVHLQATELVHMEGGPTNAKVNIVAKMEVRMFDIEDLVEFFLSITGA